MGRRRRGEGEEEGREEKRGLGSVGSVACKIEETPYIRFMAEYRN